MDRKHISSAFALLAVALFCFAPCACSLAAASDTSPPQSSLPEVFFGMHVGRAGTRTPWPSVRFATWRLWDSGVAWPRLEPRKGEWHFELLDKYVDLAAAHNVEILLPLGLSPPWASARPHEPPRDSPGSAAEPHSLDDWRNYVRTVATRYKGRIRCYEIWNEPNFKRFFTGSEQQMVDLTREAYRVLKDVDLANILVAPAPTMRRGLPWFETFLRLGGAQYADVIGYHLYVNPGPPEDIVPLVAEVRSLMARYGAGDKALWNTETGWAVKQFASPEEEAAYLLRAMILSWAGGVSRFYWYAWDNTNFVTLHVAERDTVTVTAAGHAFAGLQQWLVGSTARSCSQAQASGVWVCELENDSRPAWILWHPEGTFTFHLPPSWKVAYSIDILGARRPLAPARSVEIGITPVLLTSFPFAMNASAGTAH
jgi:hypothetical protein